MYVDDVHPSATRAWPAVLSRRPSSTRRLLRLPSITVSPVRMTRPPRSFGSIRCSRTIVLPVAFSSAAWTRATVSGSGGIAVVTVAVCLLARTSSSSVQARTISSRRRSRCFPITSSRKRSTSGSSRAFRDSATSACFRSAAIWGAARKRRKSGLVSITADSARTLSSTSSTRPWRSAERNRVSAYTRAIVPALTSASLSRDAGCPVPHQPPRSTSSASASSASRRWSAPVSERSRIFSAARSARSAACVRIVWIACSVSSSIWRCARSSTFSDSPRAFSRMSFFMCSPAWRASSRMRFPSARASASRCWCSLSTASASACRRSASSIVFWIAASRASSAPRIGFQANFQRIPRRSRNVTIVQTMSPGSALRRSIAAPYAPGAFSAIRMQMTSAKSATPSISAAAMIIVRRISPAASGCRAIPSMAGPASLPMPSPAPISASPAPSPAPSHPSPKWISGMTVLLLVGVTGQVDEHGGQHGGDVRLDERDQELEQEDEEREADRDRHDQPRLQEEDQPQHAEDDDVAGGHVGEQTDHERERLGEVPDDLDRDHDGRQEERHALGHERFRVAHRAVGDDAADLYGDHREQSEHPRHGEVAGRRATVRHQPQQVHEQDEEEERGDERHVGSTILAPDVRVHDLVADVDDERLERVVEAVIHAAAAPRHREKDEEEERRCDPHVDGVLRDRQVEAEEMDLGQVDLAERRELHHAAVGQVMDDVDALFRAVRRLCVLLQDRHSSASVRFR